MSAFHANKSALRVLELCLWLSIWFGAKQYACHFCVLDDDYPLEISLFSVTIPNFVVETSWKVEVKTDGLVRLKELGHKCVKMPNFVVETSWKVVETDGLVRLKELRHKCVKMLNFVVEKSWKVVKTDGLVRLIELGQK